MFTPRGRDIKRLREKLGISQTELAKRVGISQSFIAKIENEKIDPRLSTINRILEELLNNLSFSETVEKVMKSPVISATDNESLPHVFELMEKNNISQLPVIDSNGIIKGMIYDYVILRKVISKDPLSLKAKDVMIQPPPLLRRTTPIEAAMKTLTKNQVVVVIDDKMRPIGIITRSDIIKYKMYTTNSILWAAEEPNGI
ncbi:inosine-5-monophosphate dehydrogenase [Sulfolobales archaeon HS-7]|nr:inosine-5-monophosphate dehydrogenase [Sulfolobales archaeon HS-7]